ncbi:MAG: hypothetical protein U0930_08955 [Pirellulales bacterium]
MMTPTAVQDYLTTSSRIASGDFVFLVCQHGTESVLKQFLLYPNSPFRLAYSRPGLLTFKLDQPVSIPQHPLIRLAGRVIGQIEGQGGLEMAEHLKQLAFSSGQIVKTASLRPATSAIQTNNDSRGAVGVTFLAWEQLHIFERDRAETGMFGFEPGTSPLSTEVGGLARQVLGNQLQINQIVEKGTRVLDCVLVDPNHWLVGWHSAEQVFETWPGGVFPVTEPADMISRAYLKMAEGIAWSALPFSAGDKVVEVGSAPGGASQRLLDMGMHVTGVDPAEMDPMLLEHSRFEHWRSKSSAVKRKNYAKFRWLVADANVAPNYTLDCVGDIVNYPTSRIDGLILTLKLSSYELLDNLDEYLERIASWGFSRVGARQLGHNRHELCVVAQR